MQIENYKVFCRNKAFLLVMRAQFAATVFVTAGSRNSPNVHQLVMDKQDAVCSCNGMLFDHEKERSSAMGYHADAPPKWCARYKGPGTAGHIVNDSIYRTH